jgi:hypothetical protein
MTFNPKFCQRISVPNHGSVYDQPIGSNGRQHEGFSNLPYEFGNTEHGTHGFMVCSNGKIICQYELVVDVVAKLYLKGQQK